MRDQRDFNRTDQWILHTENGRTGQVNNTYWQVDSKSVYSERDEPTSTLSVDGKYFIPTTYYAIFIHTSPRYGYAEWTKPVAFYPQYKIVTRIGKEGAAVVDSWKIGLTASLRPSVDAKTIASCRDAVLEALRNTDVDLGASIGELPETLKGMLDLVKDLTSLRKAASAAALSLSSTSIAAVRKMLRKGSLPKGVSKRAAQEYLRLMYGVRPIVMDAYAISDQIEKGITSAPIGHVEKRRSSQVDLSSFNQGTYITFTGKVETGVLIGVDVLCSNPTSYQLWRYGVTNPLAVAWELLSLSFVVDFFTGIGSFVQAIQQPMGVVAINGYETIYTDGFFTKRERLSVPYLGEGNSPGLVVDGSAQVDIRTKCMQRFTTIGFTPPAPYISLGLNDGQVATIVALITALRRG